jgi:hypothetical protein
MIAVRNHHDTGKPFTRIPPQVPERSPYIGAGTTGCFFCLHDHPDILRMGCKGIQPQVKRILHVLFDPAQEIAGDRDPAGNSHAGRDIAGDCHDRPLFIGNVQQGRLAEEKEQQRQRYQTPQ